MDDLRVLTGKHFMNGDEACAEGALAAGCSFFGGYPITPSTEIAEHLARRMPEIGAVFIQMEDELASMAAILGASAAGSRSMTATSGPGLSLMLENLGDPLCGGRRPAWFAFNRIANHAWSIGCNAGSLGLAW